MTPTERYVTMLQYYSQSVTKSVVGSVKKLRVLSKYLYPAPLKSSKGFFTLRQTHFFTCDQYSQDEYDCSTNRKFLRCCYDIIMESLSRQGSSSLCALPHSALLARLPGQL